MIEGVCKRCGSHFTRPGSRTPVYCNHSCRSKDQEKVLPVDELERLYDANWSLTDIGSKFGVSKDTVKKTLRQHGVEIRDNTDWLKWKNPGLDLSATTKEKISQGVIKYFQQDGARVRASEAKILSMISSPQKYASSKIEEQVALWLEDHGVNFRRQVPVRDATTGRFRAVMDFLIEKNIAVEVNGTFWHTDPRAYPSGPKHDSQRRALAKYQEKLNLLRDEGFALIEVWELDLKADFEGTLRSLFAKYTLLQ